MPMISTKIWVITEDLEYNKEGKPIIAFDDEGEANKQLEHLRASGGIADFHIFDVSLVSLAIQGKKP